MRERTVSQAVLRRKIHSVEPHASAFDATCIMTKARCGSVLVIDADGVLRGIFTERDLMSKVVAKGLDPQKTLMTDVMTPHPRTIRPDARVSDAVLIMKECGFRHLPIVSPASGITGVFSLRDALPREILAADQLIEYLDDEFANVPA
ncbi:MAG TPA: CBS domain-containing protein [Noviherbaspirillum sp.]